MYAARILDYLIVFPKLDIANLPQCGITFLFITFNILVDIVGYEVISLISGFDIIEGIFLDKYPMCLSHLKAFLP